MICEENSPITECLNYLKKNSVDTMPLGKYEVGNNGTYVILQGYETKSPNNCDWESHKKYVDFQFILLGEEKILVSELSKMKQGEYNEDIDFMISYGEPMEEIVLRAGTGIIFMPDDVHMPCLHNNAKPTIIRKAVFKIPVGCFEF